MLNNHYQTSVSLKALLAGFIAPELLDECEDKKISGLSNDSRKTQQDDLFFAYQGTASHGITFVEGAIENGAVAVLSDQFAGENKSSPQVAYLQCDDLQIKMGKIADRFYQQPSSKMKVTGVTGTNGKTSVAHFIAQCLDKIDKRCGVMGTLGNGFIGDVKQTGLTTADALSVHRDLEMLRANHAENVVMEVSSHGLDQGRVSGVAFDTAIFTNLSHDHLDYHETLSAYAEVKQKLFLMPGLKSAVINLDDTCGRVFAKECKNRLSVWGYSTQSDLKNWRDYASNIVQATEIKAVPDGFEIAVKTSRGDAEFTLPLLGYFNVSNALAVLSVLLINELSLEKAVQKLLKISPVAGRMEVITAKDKPTVVVDFAHTPNALEEACKAMRAHFDGQLCCVFGCGGDRDRTKRPLMAKIAQENADKIIVTNDNPRTEKPQFIVDEIAKGFDDVSNVEVIFDRAKAIAHAIEHAQTDDVILLAGKGHESIQIIDGKKIPFDDRLVAKACLGMQQ